MNRITDPKGILASVTVAISGALSFLPVLDMLLKIGVEAVGLIAGIYAARYWRHKWLNRESKHPQNRNPNHNHHNSK